jgi:hypothetical protein
MSNGDVVTLQQIKKLIEDENISPDQLFSQAYMTRYLEGQKGSALSIEKRERLEAEERERLRIAGLVTDDKKVGPEADKDKDVLGSYLDPAKNPLIKLD